MRPDTLSDRSSLLPLSGRLLALDATAHGDASPPWEQAVLNIANYTAGMLEAQGASVLVTTGTPSAASVAGRARQIEQHGTEVLIFLRTGSHPSTQIRGVRALVPSPYALASRRLAERLLRRISARTGLPSRGVPFWSWFPPDLAAVIRGHRPVSLVVECATPTCPADELLLMRRSFQMRVAHGLTEAILEHFGLMGYADRVKLVDEAQPHDGGQHGDAADPHAAAESEDAVYRDDGTYQPEETHRDDATDQDDGTHQDDATYRVDAKHGGGATQQGDVTDQGDWTYRDDAAGRVDAKHYRGVTQQGDATHREDKARPSDEAHQDDAAHPDAGDVSAPFMVYASPPTLPLTAQPPASPAAETALDDRTSADPVLPEASSEHLETVPADPVPQPPAVDGLVLAGPPSEHPVPGSPALDDADTEAAAVPESAPEEPARHGTPPEHPVFAAPDPAGAAVQDSHSVPQAVAADAPAATESVAEPPLQAEPAWPDPVAEVPVSADPAAVDPLLEGAREAVGPVAGTPGEPALQETLAAFQPPAAEGLKSRRLASAPPEPSPGAAAPDPSPPDAAAVGEPSAQEAPPEPNPPQEDTPAAGKASGNVPPAPATEEAPSPSSVPRRAASRPDLGIREFLISIPPSSPPPTPAGEVPTPADRPAQPAAAAGKPQRSKPAWAKSILGKWPSDPNQPVPRTVTPAWVQPTSPIPVQPLQAPLPSFGSTQTTGQRPPWSIPPRATMNAAYAQALQAQALPSQPGPAQAQPPGQAPPLAQAHSPRQVPPLTQAQPPGQAPPLAQTQPPGLAPPGSHVPQPGQVPVVGQFPFFASPGQPEPMIVWPDGSLVSPRAQILMRVQTRTAADKGKKAAESPPDS